MAKFGVVPVEVPVERRLSVCAPKLIAAVTAMLADPLLAGGRTEWPFETLRTDARQTFLYGFGRTYDDGRGVVTKAASALFSWHGFGLAVDVVEKDATPWIAPPDFWENIALAAKKYGLAPGYLWTRPDKPHVQWSACPGSPTDDDRQLFAAHGMLAVWRKYGADDAPPS